VAEGINKYLNAIFAKIYSNQNLCKLLYYDSVNPLGQATISNPAILYTDKENKKLFATPFSLDNTDKRKTTLTVALDRINLDSNTKFFRDITVDFIICCHNKLWELNDGSGEIKLRPAEIWNELDRTFNRQTAGGVGKNNFDYGKIIYFNDSFSGYRVCFSGIDLPIVTW
jgi:hypothetical protein